MSRPTHAQLSRSLYIDARRELRWQSMDGLSYAVIGSQARTGVAIDYSTEAPSTMSYAPNDYMPARSYNGPGEAEEYEQISAAPTLAQQLGVALGWVLVVGFVLGGLLLHACTPRALTKHRAPAWKRTALRDPEPPQPDTACFQL